MAGVCVASVPPVSAAGAAGAAGGCDVPVDDDDTLADDDDVLDDDDPAGLTLGFDEEGAVDV